MIGNELKLTAFRLYQRANTVRLQKGKTLEKRFSFGCKFPQGYSISVTTSKDGIVKLTTVNQTNWNKFCIRGTRNQRESTINTLCIGADNAHAAAFVEKTNNQLSVELYIWRT